MTLRTWLTAALTALTLSACNDTARDDNDYGAVAEEAAIMTGGFERSRAADADAGQFRPVDIKQDGMHAIAQAVTLGPQPRMTDIAVEQ